MRLIDADALDAAFTDLRFNADMTLKHWGDRQDWCLHGSEVEKLIENAPTVSGWVSVKDRMPDELDCYLVSLINHGGIDLDVYHPDEKVFSHNRQYVECWMTIPPLPEPPKEVERNGNLPSDQN